MGEGVDRRLRFQQKAAPQKIGETLRRHRRHFDLALGTDLHRAFRRQPAEGIAYGHLTDAHLLRQAAGGKTDAGHDLAGDHAAAKLFVNAGMQDRLCR